MQNLSVIYLVLHSIQPHQHQPAPTTSWDASHSPTTQVHLPVLLLLNLLPWQWSQQLHFCTPRCAGLHTAEHLAGATSPDITFPALEGNFKNSLQSHKLKRRLKARRVAHRCPWAKIGPCCMHPGQDLRHEVGSTSSSCRRRIWAALPQAVPSADAASSPSCRALKGGQTLQGHLWPQSSSITAEQRVSLFSIAKVHKSLRNKSHSTFAKKLNAWH